MFVLILIWIRMSKKCWILIQGCIFKRWDPEFPDLKSSLFFPNSLTQVIIKNRIFISALDTGCFWSSDLETIFLWVRSVCRLSWWLHMAPGQIQPDPQSWSKPATASPRHKPRNSSIPVQEWSSRNFTDQTSSLQHSQNTIKYQKGHHRVSIQGV